MKKSDSTKKQREVILQSLKAWEWLRLQKPYKDDYKKQQKLGQNISKDAKTEFRKRWGFYPLANPRIKKSFVLDEAIIKALKIRFFDVGVKCRNFTILAIMDSKWWKEMGGVIPSCPEKLVIEIDIEKPIEPIINDVRDTLVKIKKYYGITDKRDRYCHLSDMYKVFVLLRLGYRTKDIIKIIKPELQDDHVKESIEKRVHRLIRKVKSIMDK